MHRDVARPGTGFEGGRIHFLCEPGIVHPVAAEAVRAEVGNHQRRISRRIDLVGMGTFLSRRHRPEPSRWRISAIGSRRPAPSVGNSDTLPVP